MKPADLGNLAWLETAHEMRPSLGYRPGRTHDLDGKLVDPRDNGQLQFHAAPHVIRLLAPGNGFGKTATLAVEVDWCGHGDHPYDDDLPQDRQIKMVWCCQKFGQWEMMRQDIEAWWSPDVVQSWRGPPYCQYTFPRGTLSIVTAEMDWKTLQGIQPDRVFGDERIPLPLWREFIKRRRGNTRTRFALGGTQTAGIQWEYHELYLPWRAFHERQGITDEREMMRQQLHRWDGDDSLADLPGVWCWPRGGHYDNPTATRKTWAFYQATTKGNAAEREVRLHGGFRDFAGEPVFDLDALERQRANLTTGRNGQWVKSI